MRRGAGAIAVLHQVTPGTKVMLRGFPWLLRRQELFRRFLRRLLKEKPARSQRLWQLRRFHALQKNGDDSLAHAHGCADFEVEIWPFQALLRDDRNDYVAAAQGFFQRLAHRFARLKLDVVQPYVRTKLLQRRCESPQPFLIFICCMRDEYLWLTHRPRFLHSLHSLAELYEVTIQVVEVDQVAFLEEKRYTRPRVQFHGC